jgi:Ran GTPase-activating protein (RanGAP) involved in mRNA processing and transport
MNMMLLQRLVLSNNALGDVGITALSQALQHNTSLQHLDISNTEPTEKGVICLAVTLADHNHSLTSLHLSSPLLQQRPQQDTTRQLANMLARNSSLQELVLSKAGLTDDALGSLVQYGLLRGGVVQRLDLSANRLSSLAGALMLLSSTVLDVDLMNAVVSA